MSLSDFAWNELISAAHASGSKAALAITGGGSGAIGDLLRIPGASKLLVEAQVPYSEAALEEYLGAAPAQACSAETAILMARKARSRAAHLESETANFIGLGATAALASDRPRRGEHRFHVACASDAGVAHCTVVLAKDRRSRAEEEDLVARTIVLWLARACGVEAPSPGELFDADDRFTEAEIAAPDRIDALLEGAFDRVTALPDGRLVISAPTPRLVMPGSFNPMHDGHVKLAAAASDMRGQPVSFEISVTNVDKPPLSGAVVRERLQQFSSKATVELTRAPTFLEKSRLFPEATFIIGADTAERLVAARYYGDDEGRMLAALEEIGASGGSFLVAARIDGQGRLVTLGDIAIPRSFVGLLTEIPAERFRVDTSSSEIRRMAQGAGTTS